MRELSPTILQEAIQRIVAAASPQRILFESAARGTMQAHSDVDLLVIKAGAEGKRTTTAEIYRRLRGVPEAFDMVVATPEEIAQYGESPGYVFANALKDGRIVYAA